MRKPDYVLWIDPGLMNGYARYSLIDDVMVLDEYLGPKCIRMVEAAVASKFHTPRTTIGVETFIITSETHKKSQDAKYAFEMIGMMRRAVTEEYSGNHPFEFNTRQTSSDARTFCPDRILQELGWWVPGGDHCHMAARHIFFYLANKRWLNEAQKSALVPASEDVA